MVKIPLTAKPEVYRGVALFNRRADRSTFRPPSPKVAPAAWIILFQDKIHAVTRERPEGPLIVQGYADPTAMTIAGLDANRGFQKHTGTNASTSLFIEVMTDFAQTLLGNPSMWQSRLSGPAIAIELERRKGKQIRRRKAQ